MTVKDLSLKNAGLKFEQLDMLQKKYPQSFFFYVLKILSTSFFQKGEEPRIENGVNSLFGEKCTDFTRWKTM